MPLAESTEQSQMSPNPASWITRDRIDMSDWVLHFVHEPNFHNEPDEDAISFEEYGCSVYHEDPEVNYRFSDWEIMDEGSTRHVGGSAYMVLQQIISDGHIRATWAFRGGKPTIYGPRAAVCFTEMPLHALVDYAKHRRETDVECYAVGLLKSEVFEAGGRPVIYGLSTPFSERNQANRVWPRKLEPACGIAEQEQYRYVSTALSGPRQIDWTHEREWRWVDHLDKCWCPGLPVWMAEEPHSFSQVLIVVQTDEEADGILDQLKQLHDAGGNSYCVEFDRPTLDQTVVISLQQLRNELSDDALRTLRLEDIPTRQLRTFERPQATQEDLDKLTMVLAEAREVANRAARDAWEKAPKGPDGFIRDMVGFASLTVHDAQTPLVSALLQLGEASPVGDGYFIRGMTDGCKSLDQAWCLEEAAVRAAMEVFENHYPDNTFLVFSRAD